MRGTWKIREYHVCDLQRKKDIVETGHSHTCCATSQPVQHAGLPYWLSTVSVPSLRLQPFHIYFLVSSHSDTHTHHHRNWLKPIIATSWSSCLIRRCTFWSVVCVFRMTVVNESLTATRRRGFICQMKWVSFMHVDLHTIYFGIQACGSGWPCRVCVYCYFSVSVSDMLELQQGKIWNFRFIFFSKLILFFGSMVVLCVFMWNGGLCTMKVMWLLPSCAVASRNQFSVIYLMETIAAIFCKVVVSLSSNCLMEKCTHRPIFIFPLFNFIW